MGCSFEWRSPTNVFASALRSDWVPTNTIGTFLDCDRISGIHFSLQQMNMTDIAVTAVDQFRFYLTFWKVDGMTTLKQRRKTSVLG